MGISRKFYIDCHMRFSWLITYKMFRDGEGGKPWINANPNAMSDFWKSANQWLPTWPAQKDRGMTIKKIKMWQQGKCGSPN